MPAGGPGDHPLTDILVYKLEVYGQGADELIRKISELSSNRELFEWWEREIGWRQTSSSVLVKAQSQYDQLLLRAKQGGWELD